MAVAAKTKLSDAQLYAGSPVHLTTTATVTPNAASGTNSQALHNPFGVPVEIWDFKFAFNLLAPYADGASVIPLPYMDGAILGVSIDLSGDAITKDFVPVWLLGYSTNVVNEQLQGYQNATSANSYGEFIWHLRSPLYLTPADQLNISFQHYGQVATELNVRLSAVGRTCLGPKPKTRKLPYATAYQSKVFLTPLGAADSDTSTEMDLYNQTNEIVRLQRFTGRLDIFNNAVPAHTETLADLSDAANAYFTPDDLGCNLLTCQLFTGHGSPIVPYPATFRSVFSGVTRSWELHDVPLDPGDYFIANLVKAVGSGPASVLPLYLQAGIGMIGEREVPL